MGRTQEAARCRSRRLPWRNLHLVGDSASDSSFLFYSGLSANGALAQKRIGRELFRRFDRKIDFWQRNLWGHTGRYGDFRQSRMWNWLGDAVRAARALTRRPNNRNLFVIGHSTGALIAVLVAWLFQRAPGLFAVRSRQPRIAGLALSAPAFRLQNRRDAWLLLMVLLLYYIVSPLTFLMMALHTTRLWDPILVAAIAFYVLIPRIRVPTGQAVAACSAESRTEARRKCRRDQLLALLLVLYLGVFPVSLLLLDFVLPTAWVRGILWFFIGTIGICLWQLPKGEVLDADWEDELAEDPTCDGYRWLPVVTAATLLPLQWIATALIRRVSCPVLVILAGRDRVVDNHTASRLFELIPSADKQLVELPGLPHANLTVEQQQQMADLLEEWCRARMQPPHKRAAVNAANEPDHYLGGVIWESR